MRLPTCAAARTCAKKGAAGARRRAKAERAGADDHQREYQHIMSVPKNKVRDLAHFRREGYSICRTNGDDEDCDREGRATEERHLIRNLLISCQNTAKLFTLYLPVPDSTVSSKMYHAQSRYMRSAKSRWYLNSSDVRLTTESERTVQVL